ncbi:MAG: tyrosine-type recombinase/integrase [Kofleriaceae bacterium]
MIRRVERENGVRFQVYGRAGGKKVYVGTFTNERDANKAERRHVVTQEQIADGELPPDVDLRRTLKTATDAWLEGLKASKSRSHRVYSEMLGYQVLPTLGDVPIAKLTKAVVTCWRDTTITRYAPTTVNAALGCLSSACSWFVEQQWIPTNPCHGVEQAQVLPRSYGWIKTRGELERLLGTCPDELRDMIAFAVGTMVRLDEMLHMQWDDVDLEARLITVQRGRQGTPKNGHIRHVPLLDSVLPLLKRRAMKRGGSSLVFPGKKGAVRAKTPVQVAFKSALRRAAMDNTTRWHDLRHTGASWWVIGGGDIFRLSKLLGHRDVKITQKTYAHLAPEAWQQDYHRLAFHCPSEPAKVYEFPTDARGRLLGKRVRAVDARDTPGFGIAK